MNRTDEKSPSKAAKRFHARRDTRRCDRLTEKWLAKNHPNEKLANLDTNTESPDVFEVDPTRNLTADQIDDLDDEGLFEPERATYLRQLEEIDKKPNGVATRQAQRIVAERKRVLANALQVAANVEAAPSEVIAIIAALPLDAQHRVALLAQRYADLAAIRKIQSASAREKRLSQGEADILQAIGRDGAQTRRRIAALDKDARAEALADLIAEQRVAAQRRRCIEWAKQRRFDAARAIQRENCIEEIIARFRALPDEPRQSLLATLICESDEALT